MKKLFLMAIALMVCDVTFAGDSEALKSILNAKTYAEAKSLLKSGLGQLVDASEKAKAYNKLVELAMEKVEKESKIMTENQMAEQLNTGKVAPYDTLGMANALVDAINNAIECDKYDRQPNAKGKVLPKFAEKNALRIWAMRPTLVNIGQSEAQKGNNAGVLKYWGTFLDSDTAPLFAAQDHKSEQDYIGQVAYFAGRYAYEANDMKRTNRYLDIAMKDESLKKDALSFKIYAQRESLKSHADSLQFVETLKGLYNQDPDNDMVIETLTNMYGSLRDSVNQEKMLDEIIARNPKNFTALANKGLMYIGKYDVENAVKYLRMAADVNPDNAVVQTYLGACLGVEAANTDDKAQQKKLYQQAVEALDKAKSLDPDKLQAKWGYNRYQAYYGLYGPDDARTKQAEEESK